jgi:hypothetical protein
VRRRTPSAACERRERRGDEGTEESGEVEYRWAGKVKIQDAFDWRRRCRRRWRKVKTACRERHQRKKPDCE